MGRRGPLPKPTATRKREGNPANRKLPQNEPEPAKVEQLPEPPDYLDANGANAWRNLCKILKDADLLTVADLYPLEMFCDQYSEWLRAVQARNKVGRILEIHNEEGDIVNSYEAPESKLARQLANDCNKWFKVLGLGPAYRVGLQKNSDGSESIEDPLAAAIANG